MPNGTKPFPVIVDDLSDAAKALEDAKQRRVDLIRAAREQGLTHEAIAVPLNLTANGVRMIVQRAQ